MKFFGIAIAFFVEIKYTNVGNRTDVRSLLLFGRISEPVGSAPLNKMRYLFAEESAFFGALFMPNAIKKERKRDGG